MLTSPFDIPCQWANRVGRRSRRSIAWIVKDERSRELLLSQRLAFLVTRINSSATSNAERVNLQGLYSASRQDTANRNAALYKCRWRVYRVPLDGVQATLRSLAESGELARRDASGQR